MSGSTCRCARCTAFLGRIAADADPHHRQFKDPSIAPVAGPLAARAGASVALGVLLTPLGALLPTVQFGTG